MKKLFSLVLMVAAASQLQAGEPGTGAAGFQFAIVPELAIQPTDTTIHGLTINFLCGENPQQGITLGFFNLISDESFGFAWGAINYADTYRGANLGLVNLTQENFCGWQDGLINYTAKEFTGLQSGVINVAGHCRGLQFGVFNYAEKLNGVQIGVMSIAAETRWFYQFPRELAPVVPFPFVNWSF